MYNGTRLPSGTDSTNSNDTNSKFPTHCGGAATRILICTWLKCIRIMIRGEEPQQRTLRREMEKRTRSVVCICVYPLVTYHCQAQAHKQK